MIGIDNELELTDIAFLLAEANEEYLRADWVEEDASLHTYELERRIETASKLISIASICLSRIIDSQEQNKSNKDNDSNNNI